MKIIYFLIFISFLNIVSAQKPQYLNYDVLVPAIEAVDTNFNSLLDYVLEMDKKCTFYSDSIWYSITIGEITNAEDNSLLLQFEANESRGFYLENVLESYKGVIRYKNHYFFINVKILPQYYFKYSSDQYNLSGVFKKPSYHIDDSWPAHLISFKNGDYYYLGTSHQSIRCP